MGRSQNGLVFGTTVGKVLAARLRAASWATLGRRGCRGQELTALHPGAGGVAVIRQALVGLPAQLGTGPGAVAGAACRPAGAG
jgi:hypothetical protein